MQLLAEAGRDPAGFVCAIYVTLVIDEDTGRANRRIDAFLEHYYGQPAAAMRRRQAAWGGPAAGAVAWLRQWIEAGADHLIIRFAGDHERHLEVLAGLRSQIAG